MQDNVLEDLNPQVLVYLKKYIYICLYDFEVVLLIVFLITCHNHPFIDPLPHLPYICPANHLDKRYIVIEVLERVMQQTGLGGFDTKWL
jgi:hypothetical protein